MNHFDQTQMTYNTFRETGCPEDERYQEYLTSQPTAPVNNDHNLMAYYKHEHDASQPFPRASLTPFVSHDHSHGHNGTFTYDAALPISSQRFSRFVPTEYPHCLLLSQYFPQNQPSMQSFQPFHGMTEPQLMINRGVNYITSQSMPRSMDYQYSAPAHSPGLISPTITSPSLSFMSSPEQYHLHPYPTWPRSILTPLPEENIASVKDTWEEKEGPYDKPYAQLIYDALMQAPGHRMLLRDIYEWFLHNSRKAHVSGTNGWQNSIRHNLSMNQAFENDKNDPIANRGSRKANSVWALTEEAIKNGVQSTTRYRKNNKNSSSKKRTGSKAPAIQRQRSGARGGRAARRAAQLKRTGGRHAKAGSDQAELPAECSFNFNEHVRATYQDDWYSYSVASPPTPEADRFIALPYNLPQYSHFGVGEEVDTKYEADPFLAEEDQLRVILSQTESDGAITDLLRY